MHWQLSWNFKFDFDFFNVFLLEKYLKKIGFLKFSYQAYYAPFAVLRFIQLLLQSRLMDFDETW